MDWRQKLLAALLRGARVVLAVTVWNPGRFGIPPDRYANLYRVYLPIFDVAMIAAGLGAIVYGSPAIIDLSDGLTTFSFGWGIWTTAAATGALVGVVFPKLLRAEAIAKSALVTSSAVYLVCLLLLTSGGSTARFVAIGISSATVILSVWRLADIRIERLERVAATSGRQEQTAADVEDTRHDFGPGQ
jgi:hypothetical protein